MNDTASPVVRPWVRLALVALGLPNLLTGVWAVLSPQGWFDDFPGWDPRLVAAEPPFNEHLATDAGAGLLASGLILLVAAWMATAPVVRLGLIGYAAFALPHAAWHVFNPPETLSGVDEVQNTGSVVFAAVATIGLLVAVSRQSMPPSTVSSSRQEATA